MVNKAEGRVGILVQARQSSTRLRNKYKLPIYGYPSLNLVMSRLKSQTSCADFIKCIVPEDDCNEIADDVYMGHMVKGLKSVKLRDGSNDVRHRYREAAKFFELDYVVRVCGDRPFVDGGVIDATVAQHLSDPDVLAGYTNVITYSHDYEFVRGFGCEVFHRSFLDCAVTSEGRQHVTLDAYTYPESYKTKPCMSVPYLLKTDESVAWDLDTYKDWVFLDTMARKYSKVAGVKNLRAIDLLRLSKPDKRW